MWLFYVDWDLFSFPAQKFWVCALQALWAVPQRRPPAQKAPSSQAAFCCCPHSTRWLFSADCSQKVDHRTSRSEEKTRLYTSQEQILIWTQLISTRSAANSAWTPRYKITFPGDKSGIHPKKRHCEACAAKIINDLDWDGAVIADCGASQGSLWKHSILPVICGRVSAWPKNNQNPTEREKRERTRARFLGSVEPKSKQLSWVLD